MGRSSPSADPVRVAIPPARPLMVYDGECGFCRLWIDRWREETGGAVDFEPYQTAGERFPEIPPDAFRKAVHLIEPDGAVTRGAAAVFRARAAGGGPAMADRAYRRLPPFRTAAELFYRWVADHRGAALTLTRLLWGGDVRRPTYRLSLDVLLRGLALVYLIAFVSLLVQVDGLIGRQGVLPAANTLAAVAGRFGVQRFWLLPTIFWIDHSDAILRLACAFGALVAVLTMVGVAPLTGFLVMWGTYLSLCGVGQVFLGYQWDNLLLEAGLLAAFVAPTAPFNGVPMRHDPPPFGLWLIRWLLFRLMFSSGLVKLTSGDPHWHDLTALRYHFETQCLPTGAAWYAHHLPGGILKLSAGVMMVIELGLPFLIFMPRRLRLAACGGFLFLQGLIAVTGNYGFFNLLAALLCLMLVDDAVWLRLAPRRRRAPDGPEEVRVPPSRARHPRPVLVALALIFVASLVPLSGSFRRPFPWPAPVTALADLVGPFRSINGYGLFAVMTTERDEIEIEGSQDGVEWKPIPFRWKPGNVLVPPGFVAPFMPRVDWQMWFAALGDYRQNPWLLRLMGRIVEGSPPVLKLLGPNPFPGNPPRYVRALRYEYHFSEPSVRRETGAWWTRTLKGAYAPTLEGRLRIADS